MSARRMAVLSLVWTAAGLWAPAASADAPPDALSKSEVETFLQAWAKTQNDGNFAAYAALYADDFRGVRRSGRQTVQMDRDKWLKDRERMFKAPMQVEIAKLDLQTTEAGAQVTFRQDWSSAGYVDEGMKKMSLRRSTQGLRIVVEDMVCSVVFKRHGEDVIHAPPREVELARRIHPQVLVDPILKRGGDCSGDLSDGWRFALSKRATFASAGTSYEFVAWHEDGNPHAETNYDEYEGGGMALFRGGDKIWSFELSGCSFERSFQARDSTIFTVSCTEAYHGEESTTLRLYRVEKDQVTDVGTAPIAADDRAGSNTFMYKAKVEYRDVDGNGVTDVVVTPVKRRHVDDDYPKSQKVFNF
jgi:hypothetical protein